MNQAPLPLDDLGQAPPLFILSFRQRDELAALAARAGWTPIAARRTDGLEDRFVASGALVAIVDARGAMGEAIEAAAILGQLAAARGAGLLIFAGPGDVADLGLFFDAGATHFLLGPTSEQEIAHTLRFVARHAQRMAGEWRADQAKSALGWRYDIDTRMVSPSRALADSLGTGDRVLARRLLGQLSADDRRTAIAALRRLVTAGHATAFAHDVAGSGRFVNHLRIDGETGEIVAMVERLASASEAAAIDRDAARPVRDASAARRWLDARLAEDKAATLNVALISLNRFDIVNTAYGRMAGDGLLRIAQRRIESVAATMLGEQGILVRTGGSEFLFAGDAAAPAFDQVASDVAEALARPFVAGGTVIVLGCRIGIAGAGPGDDAAALLRRAGEALAQARGSDSRSIVFARDMTAQASSIDRLAVDLRRAIAGGEINVVFQPQVAIATGAITGVEALARWEHPTMGPLGAETLFAAAERAELVIALSDHIQQIALEQAARWPVALGTLRLSINLTAADIARPGFADIFIDRLDSSGFPRDRLTVEITEGGLIDDLGMAAALLTALRSAGCRVAIDDFGTGYSSLAYLKALPLDYLKIDKNMTQDITGGVRDRIVVRGVIDMARSLGLSVIAEGVETPEQLDLLAKEGCQYFQGFLCAAPLDIPSLVDLVDGEKHR